MKRRRVFAGTIGALVLGGVLVASYGASYGQGVAKGGSKPPMQNPLTVIITKLDQILAALTGGGAGNHTLRWDSNNESATRFTPAFPGAVLDNNTGLVWEQAPDGTPRPWISATSYCVNKNVGGTRGWRLPSVVELASLIDGTPGAVAPFVPSGPFTLSTSDSIPGVQSAFYWSATTFADGPNFAWFVLFLNGLVTHTGKINDYHAWCVRGGMQADAY
jgi:Protein of unknown function (DUF1566)